MIRREPTHRHCTLKGKISPESKASTTSLSDDSSSQALESSSSGQICSSNLNQKSSRDIVILASGVQFLVPKHSPLLRRKRFDRIANQCGSRIPTLLLPNVDAISLAKVIHWYSTDCQETLEPTKDNCVSLLRIATIFNLRELSESCCKVVLEILELVADDMVRLDIIESVELQKLVQSITECHFQADDVLLCILQQVILSSPAKTSEQQNEGKILKEMEAKPAFLNPVAKRIVGRRIFQKEHELKTSTGEVGNTADKRRPTLLHWFAKPKLKFATMLSKNVAKPEPADTKRQAKAKPQTKKDAERKSSTLAKPSKIIRRNPLAHSVIRYIPRKKPVATMAPKPSDKPKKDLLSHSVIRKVPRKKPS